MAGFVRFSAILLSLFISRSSAVVIDVNTTHLWGQVYQSFLSVSIDARLITRDYGDVKFDSAKLLALCRGITGSARRAEVFLRIGGDNQDDVEYKPQGGDQSTPLILSNEAWDAVNEFAFRLRWRLLYGLNLLSERKADGTWDPSNAITLMRYSVGKGYVVQYELGNEPDRSIRRANFSVLPEQLAKDYTLLKLILQMEARGEPILIGPDVSSLTDDSYFVRFLRSLEADILDGISYHYRTENVTLENLMDPSYHDKFLQKGFSASNIVKSQKHLKGIPLWISEVALASSGNNESLGGSFADGFGWLDQLGLAAQLNVYVIIKQSLIGDKSSLIDLKTLDPTPLYWISILHKQLIGTKVLHITGLFEFGRQLRLYAHCANVYGGRGYGSSDVVVFGMNLGTKSAASLSFGDELASLSVDQYLFTPGNGTMTDRTLKLNGKLLEMKSPTSLPDLKPLPTSQPIELPSLSYGFFVLRDANAEACVNNRVQDDD